MGRRAKNKQADPKPFEAETSSKPSQKKLGKRKADPSDGKDNLSKRPTKKVKEDDNQVPKVISKKKSKASPDSKERKTDGAPPAKAKRKHEPESEEEEGEESDQGWEDVESDADISAAKKYALLHILMLCFEAQPYYVAPSSMIATKKSLWDSAEI